MSLYNNKNSIQGKLAGAGHQVNQTIDAIYSPSNFKVQLGNPGTNENKNDIAKMHSFYHEAQTSSQQESPRLSSKKQVSRNGTGSVLSKSMVKESRSTKTYQRRNVYTSN